MRATKSEDMVETLAARPPLELVDLDAGTAAPVPPALAYAVVIEAAALTVMVAGVACAAKRAKSCLVAPEPGDRVLCAVDGATAYVLAVLDGAPETTIVADGKLEVRADEVSLVGRRVALKGAEVEVAGDALKIRAEAAVAVIDDLRLLGRSIEANLVDRAVLLAERVETRATRLLQRTKQMFRFVEELEQARVGHYDLRAEGLAAIRAENTIVSARVLSKLDGEQVKIG